MFCNIVHSWVNWGHDQTHQTSHKDTKKQKNEEQLFAQGLYLKTNKLVKERKKAKKLNNMN